MKKIPRAMNRRRRIVTIALALVAASLLALAVQGGRWWTLDDVALGDVAIGPISGSRCAAPAPAKPEPPYDERAGSASAAPARECKPIGLGWLGGDEGWTRTGIATYTAGLLAALMLVISAGLLAAKKTVRVIAGSGLVAVVTAAIAGAAFFATYPGLAGTAVGRGAWFYAGGIVMAAAAHLSVLRLRSAPAPAAAAA
jgi:hypothetical protein